MVILGIGEWHIAFLSKLAYNYQSIWSDIEGGVSLFILCVSHLCGYHELQASSTAASKQLFHEVLSIPCLPRYLISQA